MRTLVSLALLLVSGTGSVLAAESEYSGRIQPILSEYCYSCHGPDAGSREAGLRLDTREGACQVNDKGRTAVSPGASKDSEMIRRILSTDPEQVMPPPKSKRSLSAEQKEALKHWIDSGATWDKHWSFVAPTRPPVPSGEPNPIDAFIRERLARENLAPSPEAPREKLLRRVSMDLTGLPPSPAELDAYLRDGSPDAYEKAVDRLLASSRFGERMVWDWLDAARYADTNGYQGDPTRAMWYWRDWVIRAFNDNMPFDRFTIEQLAGDLLPGATQDQLVATGFHRNHMINGEGGRDPEESRVDYVMDRTETTGTVWMGLTMQCCRCHDHKFDPLPQKDYYRLSAFFNSIDESGGNDAGGLAHPIMNIASPEEEKHLADLREAEAAARRVHEAELSRVDAEQPAWEQRMAVSSEAAAWTVLVPDQATSSAGATLVVQGDGSVLVRGTSADKDNYHLSVPVSADGITAIKLEALPDSSFPNSGPGRADNGNFVLSELILANGTTRLPYRPLAADFEQGGWPFANVADGNENTGWAVMPSFGRRHEALLALDTPLAKGSRLTAELHFQTSNRQHTLGHFRLWGARMQDPIVLAMSAEVRAILQTPADTRPPKQQETLRDYHRRTDPGLAEATKRRDMAHAATEAAEKSLPKTMVMRERAKPRDTFVLVKGNFQEHADKVDRGVPGILPPLPAGAATDRLALARWLVAPEHPLTARVTVNRYWQMLFGSGLVKTAEDFGVQGERPSHPALLDWLAVEFRESGWDVKKLLRLIVTSRTYRQSSVVPPGMAERDPENRLLARGPRHRMPSWMLRDHALAVSGLLVEKTGGPPVKGYQPAGVWEDATFGQIQYVQDHGAALYRRSLYLFWRRIVGPTLFFDVSPRNSCSVRTGITNTPLQALVTLNDVTYTEAARVLAQRLLKEGGASDAERLAFGFRLCTCRPPDADETRLLTGALTRLRNEYRADPAAARKLIASGESPVDPSADPLELAAYTGLATLLLNLDETLCNE